MGKITREEKTGVEMTGVEKYLVGKRPRGENMIEKSGVGKT